MAAPSHREHADPDLRSTEWAQPLRPEQLADSNKDQSLEAQTAPDLTPNELAPEDEDLEPDVHQDPLSDRKLSHAAQCSIEALSSIPIRQAPGRDDVAMRAELRDVITETRSRDRSDFTSEEKARMESWLERLSDHVHDPEEFVSGSFGRSLPAWKELLDGSPRNTSRKVLRWLEDGVKPEFVGTAQADPKKLEQVRAMLVRQSLPARWRSFFKARCPTKSISKTTSPSTTTSTLAWERSAS
jgi:hypothetical protein